MIGKIMDVKFRRWLYGVGVAAGSVCLVYGLITSEQLVVWLALLAALLGVTAYANAGLAGATPKHALDEDDETV